HIPSELPACLHGALARLGLEIGGIPKTYNAKRVELQKSLRSRGMDSFTVTATFLRGLDRDEQNAKSALVARWLRELTPEQEAAFGGQSTDRPAGDGPKKKKRRRRARTAELLLAVLDDRTHANKNMTELARLLSSGKDKCSVSAVSRAFRHPVYGPRIKQRYEQYGINPP